MLRFYLPLAALALLLLNFSPVEAQTVRSSFVEFPPVPPLKQKVKVVPETITIDTPMPPLRIKQSGLLVSRLASKELERWKELERLVFAEGSKGEPLHPTLRELWQWADNSGHVIYVQFQEPKAISSSTAGSFNIEQFDPTGQRHIAVMKLHLSNIDQAIIGPQTARANGFIPFSNLRKEERYAEVLGHELAHAHYVLTSLLRAYLVHELIENTNEILLARARHKPREMISPEIKARLSQRDALLKELEAQAEQVEEIVWHELTASKKTRAEILAFALPRRR